MRSVAAILLLLPHVMVAQTTVFYEDFEGPAPLFTLNTTDVGSSATGTNTWVVNNVFTGGSGSVICLGTPFPYSIGNTPAQPGTLLPSNGNYMHTASTEAIQDGILCCSFAAADGFCTAPGNHFTRMTSDVSTMGLTGVTFSFWWLCNGGQENYGEVYYSTNAGASWTQVTTPIAQYRNQGTWTQQTITLPAFDQQASIRFGFRFVNNTSLMGGQDPGFALDNIRLAGTSGGGNTILTSPVSSPFCSGQTVMVGYTVIGSFTPGNVFTAQLSDATGSFAAPVAVGSVSSTTAGTISAVIPPGTPTGTGYRVRVVSSMPVVVGTNNGNDISITQAADPGSNGALSLCTSSAMQQLFTALGGNPDPGGSWSDPFGNASNGMFIPGTDAPGCYVYTLPAQGACPAVNAQVCVTVNAAPDAGMSFSDTVCTNDTQVNMFTLLGGSPDAGGAWTSPGQQPHGPVFVFGVDVQGCYTYTVVGTPPCSNATAQVCILGVAPQPDAGSDSAIVVCEGWGPYDLFNGLGGDPQPGGYWLNTGGMPVTGIFDPGMDPAGEFIYVVPGNANCPDAMATVTVVVDPCTGIRDGSASSITASWLGQEGAMHRFRLPEGHLEIDVVDQAGRVIKAPHSSRSNTSITLELQAEAGLHILRWRSEAGSGAIRFVHLRQ